MLPSVESPLWSGLPVNVEKILREQQTLALIANFKVLQGTGDDDLAGGEQKDSKESKSDWLVALQSKCEKMIEMLPGQLELPARTAAAIKNPLFRFIEREVTVASGLLDVVRGDLFNVRDMCVGELKSTNALRVLGRELHSEIIPQRWRKYTIAEIPVTEWVVDFCKRLE